jgi:hypothetical protein
MTPHTDTQLTPWFPARVKPARVGVYQTQDSDLPGYTYYNLWDGKRWHYGDQELRTHQVWFDPWPDNAASLKRWRGLAKEPK